MRLPTLPELYRSLWTATSTCTIYPACGAWCWRPLPSVPAVRNTGHLTGPGFGVKRWLIEGTGGWALQRALRQRGIRHNPSLTGAYDFIDPDYGSQMRGWLAALPAAGGLLFCHPGHREAVPTVADPIAPARVRELDYLGSDAFLHDLQAAKVVLGPVW
jgi:hypothetical protein